MSRTVRADAASRPASRPASHAASGPAGRSAIRPAAVALTLLVLLLGAAGGASGQRDGGPTRVATVAETSDYRADLQALQERLDAAQRTDRQRRTALADTASDRVPRADAAATRAAPTADESTGDTAPADPVGPVPDSCGDYDGNRATGCTLLLDAGYPLGQMSCLERLWEHESGWNHRAENPSSGAYGIPQALPGDKMASHGDDWRTNPATQIRWGLDYIDNRYGTPCGAWQFWQANNWY